MPIYKFAFSKDDKLINIFNFESSNVSQAQNELTQLLRPLIFQGFKVSYIKTSNEEDIPYKNYSVLVSHEDYEYVIKIKSKSYEEFLSNIKTYSILFSGASFYTKGKSKEHNVLVFKGNAIL